MARYGSGDDETVITEYLDAHLEGGIKQKNLDLILDLMDEFVELKESVMEGENNMSRETALDLYVLTKLEEIILTKDRITDEDIVDLGKIQEKYTYGWYILEQSVEDQLLSIMDFKKYILSKQ